MTSGVTVADVVTQETASGSGKPGGGISRDVIISLSVTLSVLLLLLIGVAVVLVQLNKQKEALLPQSRRDRRRKTNSNAERGSRGDRKSSAKRGSQEPRSNHATERRSQTPLRKESNNSEDDPDEPRMTVNVSNELSSTGGTIICASPAPPAPMSRPPAPARAPQVWQRKILRSSSSEGGGGGGGSGSGGSVKLQAGSWLLTAPPLDAASPRRCRSADAPAEQPQ